MTNDDNEGDFDSILEDESLDDTSEDLETFEILSNIFLPGGDDEDSEIDESKLKALVEKTQGSGIPDVRSIIRHAARKFRRVRRTLRTSCKNSKRWVLPSTKWSLKTPG